MSKRSKSRHAEMIKSMGDLDQFVDHLKERQLPASPTVAELKEAASALGALRQPRKPWWKRLFGLR